MVLVGIDIDIVIVVNVDRIIGYGAAIEELRRRAHRRRHLRAIHDLRENDGAPFPVVPGARD